MDLSEIPPSAFDNLDWISKLPKYISINNVWEAKPMSGQGWTVECVELNNLYIITRRTKSTYTKGLYKFVRNYANCKHLILLFML